MAGCNAPVQSEIRYAKGTGHGSHLLPGLKKRFRQLSLAPANPDPRRLSVEGRPTLQRLEGLFRKLVTLLLAGTNGAITTALKALP